MGVEEVIGTFRNPGLYTVKRTVRGVYINGRYKLAPAWTIATDYALGALVTNVARSYQAITGGTSDVSGLGPTVDELDILDGSVHWKFLQENIIQIVASIRPVGGRGLQSMSEGEYADEDRMVFTKTELHTRSPGSPDSESDVIVIPNRAGVDEDWQIVSVKEGRTFYQATAIRLVLP